jgi:hypothetical protein
LRGEEIATADAHTRIELLSKKSSTLFWYLTCMKKCMKMVLIVMSVMLVGCSAGLNYYGKLGAGLGAGDYKVTVWSGGKPVAVYNVKNSFVNTEGETDGWFFFVDGKFIRVSGTVTVEQQ